MADCLFPSSCASLTRESTIGIKDNKRNLTNKIGRGSFTAFFFQCSEAIGCHTVHLEDD